MIDVTFVCPGCRRVVEEVQLGRDVPLSCFHDESGRRWHLACGESALARVRPNAEWVARQRWRLDVTLGDLIDREEDFT